jgi:hypothetical protein
MPNTAFKTLPVTPVRREIKSTPVVVHDPRLITHHRQRLVERNTWMFATNPLFETSLVPAGVRSSTSALLKTTARQVFLVGLLTVSLHTVYLRMRLV